MRFARIQYLKLDFLTSLTSQLMPCNFSLEQITTSDVMQYAGFEVDSLQ